MNLDYSLKPVFFWQGPKLLFLKHTEYQIGYFSKCLRISELFGGDKLVLRIRPNQFLLDDYIRYKVDLGALESPANFERSPTVRIFLQADEAKLGMT